jgi:hypothetical protein
MTKLNLKYEFDLPEDEYDHMNLVNSNKYRRLLSEIYREMRSRSKYNASGRGSWKQAYDLLWKLAKNEELNPWEEIF